MLHTFVCVEKSSKKYTQQDYAEIIALPPVYPNPSYEHCKLKVEKNPAYEFNKPQSSTSSNPRGKYNIICLSTLIHMYEKPYFVYQIMCMMMSRNCKTHDKQ